MTQVFGKLLKKSAGMSSSTTDLEGHKLISFSWKYIKYINPSVYDIWNCVFIDLKLGSIFEPVSVLSSPICKNKWSWGDSKLHFTFKSWAAAPSIWKKKISWNGHTFQNQLCNLNKNYISPIQDSFANCLWTTCCLYQCHIGQ